MFVIITKHYFNHLHEWALETSQQTEKETEALL